MPRIKNPIWNHFVCKTKDGNSGKWAVCVICNKEMQGIPKRMEKHYELCSQEQEPQNVSLINKDDLSASGSTGFSSTSDNYISDQPSKKQKISPKQKLKSASISLKKDSDIISTSSLYAQSIDEQIAKYFYATNTPFHHVMHKEFIKLCCLLRPGYTPPSEKKLAGDLLDKVHKEVVEETKSILSGENVTMCLDGWSNINNEPIICTSVVTSKGGTYLTKTIDTSGQPHDSDYLSTIAKQCILECKEKFNATVRSFVTDNAANVQKMREKLAEKDNDVIYYGCSAHILNLLAKDLKLTNINVNVVKINKYFKYTHLPHAWYKDIGGKMLVIPQDVRWNTMCDSIKSFLDNRGKLVQVCQDHKHKIDKDIFRLVNDVNLMVNCVDYLDTLKPIANALDRMQRNDTKISECVEIWYDLKEKLKNCGEDIKKCLLARENMALTPSHLAANILDHRYRGRNLNDIQKQSAFNFIHSIDKELLPLSMTFLAQKAPFPSFMFEDQFMKVEPLVWWTNIVLEPKLKEKMDNLAQQLFTASPSTAGLERLFSSFGLIQSKLRNRLTTEKADKLTFIFKHFNNIKKCNI